METKFLITNQRNYDLHTIHYSRLEQFNPTLPLVILVHGYCGDKENAGYNNPNFDKGRYRKLATALLEVGFEVLAFDLSGQGENIREPIRISHAIQDLEDVYIYAQNLGYHTIGTVGYSMGGLVSLHARLPDRKVAVFWAPAFYPSRAASKLKRKLYSLILSLRRKPIKAGANFQDVLIDKKSFQESLLGTPDVMLQQFTIPTLILQGDCDPTVQQAWTEEAFHKMPQDANHRIKIIPRAEHHFHREILQEFITFTRDFFLKHLK
ncbi:alpha/beta hydrolase [Candidatus Lokiarchaeum ossiferum]|uniref:alpha/beta hydrolase n=1 Tax=Candidatus Lokiarchaeum ossiferum TaxID=2951803 RepID=UPI00352CE463